MPTRLLSATKRSRRRRRSLGAALAESAVVLPVLVIFFGLSSYIAKLYQTKQLKQTAGRSQAMGYAAHGCQGGGGNSQQAEGEFGPAQVPEETSQGNGDTNNGNNRQMNVATAGSDEGVRESGLFGRVKTGSNFMCNESPGQDGAQDRAIEQGLGSQRGGP
jgi:hypothetical protein